MNRELVDRAVFAVHEAALFPERWPAALTLVAEASASTIAFGQRVGDAGYSSVINETADPELQENYIADGWHERNPRMLRGMTLTRRGFRGLIADRDMFTEEELARDPYQQEFATRYGSDHFTGIVLASHANSSLVLTIERGARIGPYGEDELALMNDLVRRVSDACSLALRFKHDRAAESAAAIAAHAGAVALLAESGFCLFHSAAFERLVGDVIALRGGRVSAIDRQSDDQLQSALGRAEQWSAAGPAAEQPVVLARPGGRPVLARCHPIVGAARDWIGLAKTILVLDDLAEPRGPTQPELVADAFGLTPAEAKLACRIGAARTLREVAAEERISYETARTRLKTIFDKTGTASQAALAVLVSRLA